MLKKKTMQLLLVITSIAGLTACGSGTGYGDIDQEKPASQQKYNEVNALDIYQRLEVGGNAYQAKVGTTMADALVSPIFYDHTAVRHHAAPEADKLEDERNRQQHKKQKPNRDRLKFIPHEEIIDPNIAISHDILYGAINSIYSTVIKDFYSESGTAENNYQKKEIFAALSYAGYLTPEIRMAGLSAEQKPNQYMKYLGKTSDRPSYSVKQYEQVVPERLNNISIWVDLNNKKLYGKVVTQAIENFDLNSPNAHKYFEAQNIDLNADIKGNKFTGTVTGYSQIGHAVTNKLPDEFRKNVTNDNPGYLEGQFNGPNAEEIAGIFYDKNAKVKPFEPRTIEGRGLQSELASSFIAHYDENVDKEDYEKYKKEHPMPE